MQLIIAYISVVLIWATTPLAIQWSSESVGFLFGICGRFILAAIIASVISLLLRRKLPLHTKALQTYFIQQIGSNANLGNLNFADIISVETLRLGLRGDTAV